MTKTAESVTTTMPALSEAQVDAFASQLVKAFQAETPPADVIAVISNSIKPVDPKYGLFKALVRTDVYIGGVKQHISNIRFKLDKGLNLVANSITFS